MTPADVELAFRYDASSHTYAWLGAPVPSVTQAIEWAGYSAPYLGPEEAGFRGDAVAKACELWDQGQLDLDSAQSVMPWLTQWARYCETTGFVPLLDEVRLVSPTRLFAGRLDVLGLLRDRLTVIDRKSVMHIRNPEKWVAFQTAGYAELVEENLDALRLLRPFPETTGAIGRAAVVLAPDDYRETEYHLRGDRARFLAAVTVCNTRKEIFGRFV